MLCTRMTDRQNENSQTEKNAYEINIGTPTNGTLYMFFFSFFFVKWPLDPRNVN